MVAGQPGMRITLQCCDRGEKSVFPGRSRSPNLKQHLIPDYSSICACLGNPCSSSHCLSTRGERGWIPVPFLISFIHSFHDRAHDSHDKASLISPTVHLLIVLQGTFPSLSASHVLLACWHTCSGIQMPSDNT